MQKLVSENLDEAIIISKFLSAENDERKEFKSYMSSFIEENSTDECTIEVTGMPFIELTMDQQPG